MAWTIEFSEKGKKSLAKLDAAVAKRILDFLEHRVAKEPDPRALGEALKGSELGEYWKYRVGDWRIICGLHDEKLIVYVIKVDHRSAVYKERD